MQHGGWMAEPRRGAHLNEDAPAQPHADVRTSQPVATSGSDHAIAVGRRARNERERARKPQGRNSHASRSGTTLDFSHGTAARLAEQPLQEQPSGAAVARIIIADDITFPSSCRRWGRLGRDDSTPSRSILAS